MTGGFFPLHIRTIEDALNFLPEWAEVFGGLLRAGLTAEEDVDSSDETVSVEVDAFHIVFPHVSTVLTVALSVDRERRATFYTFDLRRTNGELLWREDNHEGHEEQHGGPHHLRRGPN